MPTLDPVIVLTAHGALALLFASAAVAKFRYLSYFRGTLASYALLPAAWVKPLAIALPSLEALIALAALVTPVAMPAAAALLTVYTCAIAINIARGRRNIDCGCSGPALRQALSAWLVVRNAVLIAVALVGCAVPAARSLVAFDLMVILLALAAGAVLYAAVNQLTANLPHLSAMDSYMEPAQ